MNKVPTLASTPYRTARPGVPVGLAEASPRHDGLATLRRIIATWRWRIRFRRELEHKLKDNQHLVDDIGLTEREVAAEIAKPFWPR